MEINEICHDKKNLATPRIMSIIFTFVALIEIGGCGGSSNDGTPPPLKVIGPPDASILARVESDNTTTPNNAKVTTIISPFATAKIGDKLINSSNANPAASLLIGVDASGDTKLLRYEESEGPLSADSTLYALVRLGLNIADLPQDMEANAPQKFIRSSSMYAAGLESVRAALSDASPAPLLSQQVIDNVSYIVQDAIRMASQPIALATLGTYTLASSVNVPVPSLPYYFWNISTSTDKVWLVEEPGLVLKNRSFLAWHVETDIGTIKASEAIALPIKQTKAQLWAYYADSESSTPIQEPNEKFLIKLDQNDASRLINVQLIITKSIYSILEVSLGAAKISPSKIQKCALNVAKVVVTDSKFAALLNNLSPTEIVNYTWDKKFDIFSAVLSSCTKDGDADDQTVQNLIAKFVGDDWLSHLNIIYRSMKAARTTAAAYGTFSQFLAHAKDTVSAEICRYNGAISRCIERIEIDAINMMVNSQSDLVIRLYDSSNQLLPIPSSLLISIDKSEIAKPTATGYGVKGISVGNARLTISDKMSGKTAAVDITVSPEIETHWAGTYKPSYCTPITSDNGAFQWYFENPCNSMGPVFGGQGGFYFNDKSSKVIMESTPSGYPVRQIMDLGWKSTDDTFAFSISTGYRIRGAFSIADSSYGHEIVTNGTRVTTFKVISRTPTLISGTFELTTISAYPSITSQYTVENWRTVNTVARGDWSAKRVDQPLPKTDMKGYDFCFYGGQAINQMTIDSLSNPYLLPGWAGTFDQNACTFN